MMPKAYAYHCDKLHVYGNSPGVLAPEAVDGFRELRQSQLANLVQSAMNLLGLSYSREREERQERLSYVPKEALDALDQKLFCADRVGGGSFENAADRYVERLGRKT